MVIVVDAGFLSTKKKYHNYFIIGCCNHLAKKYPHLQFIYIVNQFFDITSIPEKNITPVVIHPLLKYPFIIQDWRYKKKIKAIIKRYNASLFISDKVLHAIEVPQCLMIDSLSDMPAKQLSKSLKHAKGIITSSQFAKSKIIKQYNIREEAINVIYHSISPIFKSIHIDEQTLIKNKYTNGVDYFLSTVPLRSESMLINVLKAFSHFKKWQKSNMQLVIIDKYNAVSDDFLNSLQKYKYRADVKIVSNALPDEIALLTASAYAAVYTLLDEETYSPVMEAMQSNIPVIVNTTGAAIEIAGEAALYAKADIYEETGNQMILLYKDESIRNKLIQKGLQQARLYSWDRTTDALWKYITEMTR